MEALVLICGAAGLVLIFTGLPVWQRSSLGARIDPYLGRSGPFRRLARGGSSALLSKPSADLRDRLSSLGMDIDAFRLQQLSWGAMGISGAAGFAAVLAGTGKPMDPMAAGLLLVIAGATGYLGRDHHLSVQARRRNERLVEELPTAIDLMTLALMSGHSIPAAFERVGEVMRDGIGSAFEAVVADTRAGATTAEALEALSRRVPDPAMARLVDSLIVALERGAPLSEVLRSQADDLRDSTRRRLLEMGGRREVLMLIPVVFLVMPVVVAFALLPGLVTLELLVP